jgi:probable F420-dependent oxidoreductase
MRFAVVSAFLPTEEIAPIAVAADELGYDSLTIADHVVDLETLATPYPYTDSGRRRWDETCEWPDPWVLVGALAAQTTRLRFFTSIYVAALRSPYQVAKSVGTASVLSDGRVALGVGVGWCREEFDLLGQDFGTRGARTDEALELMRELWSPGWTSYDGAHYPTPRLVMRPEPSAPVPILVGGLSDVALRRASRYDGWVGDICTVDEAVATATRLRTLREEAGLDGPFEVIPALSDAILPDDFARAGDAGVTEVMTAPWMYYFGRRANLQQKLEGLHRFHDDVLVPLR